MKKRLLVITIIVTLILNQFALSALSTSPDSDENLDYAQKLKKIGVFVGSDDGFELDRPATRLEGIIMLIRLLGEEEYALNTYDDIPFTDVPSWASGYVAYAYNHGLSNGVSDTKFGSTDALTNVQYFTFMLRALGYFDSDGDFDWRESISFMQDINFITPDEQEMYESKTLLRSDVAKLSYQLMKQPVHYSRLTLANKLLDLGVLDIDVATEIGVYSPLQTTRDESAIIADNTMIVDYDTLNIDLSVKQGYPSPFSVPETTSATNDPTNIITFTNGLSGQALFDSLTHSGFDQVKAVYKVTDMTWYNFGDDLSISESPTTLTAKLKKENLYENEYEDVYSQSHNYYKKEDNIYYEVTEVLLGNYSDPIEELTKDTYGIMAYMQAFEDSDSPSYNPLLLTFDDELLYVTFTMLNNETVLYLEKKDSNTFSQQWVSLKEGLVIQEYRFDSEGIIQSIKINTSVSHEAIADTVFDQPDLNYFDVTLLIFALTYNNLESLELGLKGTLSAEPFSFDLVENNETAYTIHTDGYDGGDELDHYGYISYHKDSLGNDIELRQLYDGEYFHTISPSMETDQVFEGSVDRLLMFDFDELSFRDFETVGTTDIYTFEDTSYAGISGLLQFYDYEINTTTNKIMTITMYGKDSITSSDRYNEHVYTLENFGDYDSALFDIVDDFTPLITPLEVYYDGEHPLQWYYYYELESE